MCLYSHKRHIRERVHKRFLGCCLFIRLRRSVNVYTRAEVECKLFNPEPLDDSKQPAITSDIFRNGEFNNQHEVITFGDNSGIDMRKFVKVKTKADAKIVGEVHFVGSFDGTTAYTRIVNEARHYQSCPPDTRRPPRRDIIFRRILDLHIGALLQELNCENLVESSATTSIASGWAM